MVWCAGVFLAATVLLAEEDEPVGLIQNDAGAFQGYTLFNPLGTKTTYLIDMDGRVVNQWTGAFKGQSCYLLENGHLLRTGTLDPEDPIFDAGGASGLVHEFNWEGEVVWEFKYADGNHLTHHDLEPLPNGNVLMIAYERKSEKEAIAAGRVPELVGERGLWTDHIIEVKPTGKSGGEIVWEWHLWDHLIQDYDPRRANYGVIGDHPERVNINPADWQEQISPEERDQLETLGYLGAAPEDEEEDANPDWNHTNAIAYNAQLDQIALSVLGFNEILVIDHSTTTEEAAGGQSGKAGQGGDVLYRWGNPSAYRQGGKADQTLFGQHNVQWIEPGLQGAGHILVFNNGRARLDGEYSSVDEIVPPVDQQGRYLRKGGGAFGPSGPVWSYTDPEKTDFFSGHISGVQRLKNGNTLICAGAKGTIFEVTSEGNIVWKYINPVIGEEREKRDPKNTVFRARRYGPNFPGLKGRTLTPGRTVEELMPPPPAKDEPSEEDDD